MKLFLSTIANKIDRKGRVSVPASFRAVLEAESFQGIIAYPSFINPCIEACGMARIEQLSASIDQLDPFSTEHDAFATSILGASHPLGFDGEGRITLPEALIQAASLEEKIIFVGKGKTFEMWNPDRFEAHASEARTQAITQRSRLQLKPNTLDRNQGDV
jgi:MraZ protein